MGLSQSALSQHLAKLREDGLVATRRDAQTIFYRIADAKARVARLESELKKVDNVTVYVFLYPLERLHPGATAKSMKIWCAPDRAKAWLSAVHDGIVPDGKGDCENPVAKLAEFGQARRITGTPTMMFENGTRIAGAVTAERLEQLLGENAAKP